MHPKRIFLLVLAFALGIVTACSTQQPSPTPTLIIPTAMPTAIAGGSGAASPTPLPTTPAVPTLPSAPTLPPLPSPTTVPPTPTLVPTPDTAAYRVAFVAEDDTLNVRAEPGANRDIVGQLNPNAATIRVTGPEAAVAGSTWVRVTDGSVTGWVNSRFLTEMVPEAAFCQELAVQQLLDDLETAVATQDGALLASLIHPERGLRVRISWWNPEILLPGQARATLFASARSYDWGIQDGSGLPISGSFAEEILPLLQRDLLSTSVEMSCNEIVAGATTGLVQLPDGYDGVNYVSLFRPSADASGFDWGTWVVGIEKWRGQYTLSFLVHFAYEI